MTEKEVILECCGTDEKGYPKADCYVTGGMLTLSTGDLDKFFEFMTRNAIVNFERGVFQTKVTLTFQYGSKELKELWNHLNQFKQFADRITKKTGKVDNIVLVIQPSNLEAEYYVQLSSLTFSVTSTDIDRPCDSIMFFAQNDFVGVYHMVDEDEDAGENKNNEPDI